MQLLRNSSTPLFILPDQSKRGRMRAMGSERREFRAPQPLPQEEVQQRALDLMEQFEQAFAHADDFPKDEQGDPLTEVDLTRGDTTWHIDRHSAPDKRSLHISAKRINEEVETFGRSSLVAKTSEKSSTNPIIKHESNWRRKRNGDRSASFASSALSEQTPNTEQTINSTKALLVQFNQR
jgi:hypothetical protein